MKKNKIIMWTISLVFIFMVIACGYFGYNYTIITDKNISNTFDENVSWYSKYRFISHSLGEINGHKYTNSKEGFENSYSNGNRIFDADVIFTRDDVLVLRHSWTDDLGQNDLNTRITTYDSELGMPQIKKEEKPSYEEFMSSKIFSEYTPMSFEDLLEFMRIYQDMYVAIDCKEDISKTYQYIVDMANNKNQQEILNRIIVSFYRYEDYDKVNSIYPFKNYAIRQYPNLVHDWNELLSFCLQKKIYVVNVSKKYVNKKELKPFLENGIKIFVETVDTKSEMKKLQKEGVSGFITNSLYENKI